MVADVYNWDGALFLMAGIRIPRSSPCVKLVPGFIGDRQGQFSCAL